MERDGQKIKKGAQAPFKDPEGLREDSVEESNARHGDRVRSNYASLGLLCCGGRYRFRTCDPYHVKVVLYR